MQAACFPLLSLHLSPASLSRPLIAASAASVLKAGDEILAVNGRSIANLKHTEVVREVLRGGRARIQWLFAVHVHASAPEGAG